MVPSPPMGSPRRGWRRYVPETIVSVWLEHLWVWGKERFWRKEVSLQPRENGQPITSHGEALRTLLSSENSCPRLPPLAAHLPREGTPMCHTRTPVRDPLPEGRPLPSESTDHRPHRPRPSPRPEQVLLVLVQGPGRSLLLVSCPEPGMGGCAHTPEYQGRCPSG